MDKYEGVQIENCDMGVYELWCLDCDTSWTTDDLSQGCPSCGKTVRD